MPLERTAFRRSNFYTPFQLQKWTSKKSNSSVKSSCALQFLAESSRVNSSPKTNNASKDQSATPNRDKTIHCQPRKHREKHPASNVAAESAPLFSPSTANHALRLGPFFSVQRLHGFRQVVQHVQLHVAKIGLINELKHTHGRLRVEGPQE